jgi:recombination protein RecT
MFQNALSDQAAPFIASIMEIYSGDSTLVTCDPGQVIKEAGKAAILKLPIIKSLGFAWVVPYKKNGGPALPQFQIGYKGYIQLAMRTGQYRTINCDVVYKGELQKLNKLTGELAFNGQKESDEVVGYFAYFELLNGFNKTLYRSKEDMIKHAQKYSKSWGKPSSPWTTEFDAMSLKTQLRGLLSHYGYLSIEMMNAIAQDNDDTLEEERDSAVAEKGNKKELNITDATFEEISKDERPKDLTAFVDEANHNEGPDY